MKKNILLTLCLSAMAATGATLIADPINNETQLLSDTQQVTTVGKRSGEGYFSADGKWMIFQSERDDSNPFYQIYLKNLATGETNQVSPGIGKTTCSWIHPSGKKVLFSSTHKDPLAEEKQRKELEERITNPGRRYAWDFDENFEIYQASTNGRHLKNLSRGKGYDAEASYSPDGKWIAFSSNRHIYERELTDAEKRQLETDPSYFLDLYIMRSNGRGLTRLTNTPGYDGGPFFSADGKKITWRRFSEDGRTAEIYTMNLDGSNETKLTNLGVMSWAPYFHPSGDYIIFATNVHGHANFELYLVDANGEKEPIRVTESEGFDGLPVFTPDGTKLSWTSTRGDGHSSQIFMADWNDKKARELLGIPQRNLDGLSPEISQADLQQHVLALTDKSMDGRLTGTPGNKLATAYVEKVFRYIGLEPAGDNGSFFQEFEFTSGVSLGRGNDMKISVDGNQTALELDNDWRPLAFSKLGKLKKSEIVFAGYGIISPETDEFPEYNSYAHLDQVSEIKDKWILMFRYVPEGISSEFRQHLFRYASLRHKAMTARDMGAKGIIVVSGPNSNVKEDLVKLSFDASIGGSSIAAISINDNSADAILSGSEKTLKQLQDQLDDGSFVTGFLIPNASISGKIDIKMVRRLGRNVIGVLKATNPSAPAIILGAHVDHLGHGETTGSRARDDEKGMIHYGADDNASGTSSILEIAQYFSSSKGKSSLQRDLIFAAWSGEELGLLGSTHFVKPYQGQDKIAAYLNLDMVGRYRDHLLFQSVGSSDYWPTAISGLETKSDLVLKSQNDPYLPTDSMAFYLKGIPTLNGFTGSHDEYHSPRDRYETLNFPKLTTITELMADVMGSLAHSNLVPNYKKVERSGPGGGGFRVYLGTIPDYSNTDVKGVLLSGVKPESPASKAGLGAGDVIVELAGRAIENIYDYTYALQALKPNKEVKIVIERSGKRIELKITPESRE